MLYNNLCHDFAQIKPTYLPVLNNQYICVKKDPTLTYSKIYAMDSAVECPQQKCAIYNKQVCAEDCPVTNLTISDNQVYLSRNETAEPIIYLSASENQPCLFPSDSNVTPNKQDYVLMEDEWYDGCTQSTDGYKYS